MRSSQQYQGLQGCSPRSEATAGSGEVPNADQGLIRQRTDKLQRLRLYRGQGCARVRTVDERVDLTQFDPVGEAGYEDLVAR